MCSKAERKDESKNEMYRKFMIILISVKKSYPDVLEETKGGIMMYINSRRESLERTPRSLPFSDH
jgi:hypothetical protein